MQIFNFLFFIVGVQFLYPALVRYGGLPPLPSLSIELLIFVLFLFVILKADYRKLFSVGVAKTIYILAFIYLAIIISSAIVNSNNALLVFKSILEYNFTYIFLFLIIISENSTEAQQTKLIRWIYFLILFQIPVIIYQYYFEPTNTADSISGTLSMTSLGGTGINAVLSMFLLSILICKNNVYRFKDVLFISNNFIVHSFFSGRS